MTKTSIKTANMELMQPALPPYTPPPNFNPCVSNPINFLKDFERSAECNFWNNSHKVYLLGNFLEGYAYQWYIRYKNENSPLTWTDIKKDFYDEFGGPQYERKLRFKLNVRVQLENEDIKTYYYELLNLYFDVYEIMNFEDFRDRFERGLNSTYVEPYEFVSDLKNSLSDLTFVVLKLNDMNCKKLTTNLYNNFSGKSPKIQPNKDDHKQPVYEEKCFFSKTYTNENRRNKYPKTNRKRYRHKKFLRKYEPKYFPYYEDDYSYENEGPINLSYEKEYRTEKLLSPRKREKLRKNNEYEKKDYDFYEDRKSVHGNSPHMDQEIDYYSRNRKYSYEKQENDYYDKKKYCYEDSYKQDQESDYYDEDIHLQNSKKFYAAAYNKREENIDKYKVPKNKKDNNIDYEKENKERYKKVTKKDKRNEIFNFTCFDENSKQENLQCDSIKYDDKDIESDNESMPIINEDNFSEVFGTSCGISGRLCKDFDNCIF